MENLKLTYAGQYDNGDKSLKFLYLDEDEKKYIFKRKLLSTQVIGNKLTCIREDEGTYTQFIEVSEKADKNFIDEHIARQNAVFTEWKIKRDLRKFPKSEYEKLTENLKRITADLTQQEKKILIMKMLLDIL